MKKLKQGRKFHRKKDQRRTLLKSLAYSLILNEKIETTFAKAKETSSFVEKLITKAKKKTLASRREIVARVGKRAAKKLIDELAPLFEKREGGYTRIYKLAPRKSDGAKMAILEFVEKTKKEKKPKSKK